MSTATPTHPLSLPVVWAGAFAFLTLGVLQAVYGPAFPAFEERYGVTTAQVGLMASAHFIGSASAPPLAGLLLTRLGLGRVVTAGFVLLAAGVSLVALAPSWPLALLGALVGGLGLGGVSAALNASYALFGTQAINFVNAVFGVGSMLAPLLLTLSAARGVSPLPLTFGTIAGLAVLSLLVFAFALSTWGLPRRYSTLDERTQQAQGGKLGLFTALMLLYVGLEVGTGAWAAKALSASGHAHPALMVSAYWGGLTVSRILTSLFGARFAAGRLVLGAAVLATLAAGLSLVPALAPLAYVLVGLACGPIFPTTLAWAAQHLPPRLLTLTLVGGSAGGILMPWLLGLGFAGLGAWAVPALLTLCGVLLSALVLLTLRLTRRLPPMPPEQA